MEHMNITIKTVYTPAEAAEYLGISINEFKRIELKLAPKKNKNNRLFIPHSVLLKIEKYITSPPRSTKSHKKKEVFLSSKVFSIEEAAEFFGISVKELRKIELESAPKNNRYNRLFYPEVTLQKFKRRLEKRTKEQKKKDIS